MKGGNGVSVSERNYAFAVRRTYRWGNVFGSPQANCVTPLLKVASLPPSIKRNSLRQLAGLPIIYRFYPKDIKQSIRFSGFLRKKRKILKGSRQQAVGSSFVRRLRFSQLATRNSPIGTALARTVQFRLEVVVPEGDRDRCKPIDWSFDFQR